MDPYHQSIPLLMITLEAPHKQVSQDTLKLTKLSFKLLSPIFHFLHSPATPPPHANPKPHLFRHLIGSQGSTGSFLLGGRGEMVRREGTQSTGQVPALPLYQHPGMSSPALLLVPHSFTMAQDGRGSQWGFCNQHILKTK